MLLTECVQYLAYGNIKYNCQVYQVIGPYAVSTFVHGVCVTSEGSVSISTFHVTSVVVPTRESLSLNNHQVIRDVTFEI